MAEHQYRVVKNKFYLFVTGRGERDFIVDLLNPMVKDLNIWAETGGRTIEFERPEFIGQTRPTKENREALKVTGTLKRVPNRLEDLVTIPTLKWLKDPDAFVLLIDDLERYPQPDEAFWYYRAALDKALPPDWRARASVHFFVNMLEAYYFAHPEALKEVLGTELTEPADDVENISHPKDDLKNLVASLNDGKSFDEKSHGALIVKCLDLERILDNPKTCRSLRTLVGWCRHRLGAAFDARFRLSDGDFYAVTRDQIPWPSST